MNNQQVLTEGTVQSSELVNETFEFWLHDHEHIRSPFPAYIHNDLRRIATERFFNWAKNLKDAAKDEMNDEMIGEKFEEIIFDVATALVLTEDEKVTILYPFLPRTGDKIMDENQREGIVTDRVIERTGDKSFLRVKLVRDDNSSWTTSFELPL
ncbi:MAG: hypothetical protein IPM74_13670 [Crocinitomicaceae bacterium]|nr:hypothetical protein [Crocinitomicaceae bacterium]MBK8926923.1 hypothetical protein [Crocinitomicaceae bacterium]